MVNGPMAMARALGYDISLMNLNENLKISSRCFSEIKSNCYFHCGDPLKSIWMENCWFYFIPIWRCDIFARIYRRMFLL